MRIIRLILAVALLAVIVVGASSCVVVKPYERDVLADPIMQFDYFDLDRAYMLKLFETREGSGGGYGGASGGCGCK